MTENCAIGGRHVKRRDRKVLVGKRDKTDKMVKKCKRRFCHCCSFLVRNGQQTPSSSPL